MTTRQYISAALISGAMFMCGFGVHAAYASTEAVNKTCWCGNAFICLMDSVADEEPLLWAKVESSTEWQEFATAYINLLLCAVLLSARCQSKQNRQQCLSFHR